MSLTVLEQSSLPVRAQANPEQQCLGVDQAVALIDLGERIKTRIATWEGRESLRLQHFVGVARTGDLQLEILPKIEGQAQPARSRQSLLAMLAKTQDLRVRASELARYAEGSEPFFRTLARLYVDRLLEAVRRGLREDYVAQKEHLLVLRGKVHWPAQARLQSAGRLELPCSYDERSEDNPLNRTLKAGFRLAEWMLEGARAPHLLELRHALGAIAEPCPSTDQRARLRTDRRNRHLEPLLTLAKLLLMNQAPDFGQAAANGHLTYALMWDMNRLFEEYVGQVAQDLLPPLGFEVILQGDASYLARDAGSRAKAFHLSPDLIALRERKPWLLADMKWKIPDPRSDTLGVSSADVYQVMTYAHHYHVSRAVLIYPHHPALGPPGLQREFLTEGRPPIAIRIVTVDLAQLDRLPDQLSRGLISP